MIGRGKYPSRMEMELILLSYKKYDSQNTHFVAGLSDQRRAPHINWMRNDYFKKATSYENLLSSSTVSFISD